MPDALEAAGAVVEPHRRHFPDDSPDTEWLPVVGRRGWIVLTKDHRIRHNPLEREALLNAGAKTFILTSGQLSGAEMAEILVKQLPKIERCARNADGALIARVTRTEVAVVEKRRARRQAATGSE